MFNLIVGYTDGVADAARVPEYTEEALRDFIAPDGCVDPARVLNLPTLIMPETGDAEAEQVAKLGRLTHVTPTGNHIRYAFTATREMPSALVVAAAPRLGIAQFEFTRHHWAIKDVDVHAVLSEHDPSQTPRSRDSLDYIAQLLVQFSEGDVDAFLSAVGGPTTRSGWEERPRAVRRLELTPLLRQLAREQLDALELALMSELLERDEQLEAAASSVDDGGPGGQVAVATTATTSAAVAAQPTVDPAGPIFVVHGHDHAALHLAVRVLERSTGREVIVLHEKANAGRTVLEKFEHHAASAAFAVVLLTADDEGAVAGSSATQRRARQNVIFELGFFFGQLGRERVVVLVDEGVEKPSDINGLVYVPLDRAGGWKGLLGRELEAASIAVDYARMP